MATIEILSTRDILTETAAAEFYKLDGHYYAIVNGKTSSLDEFITLSNKDDDYADVVVALKKKMKLMSFTGDVKDFIKKYFKAKNERLDVLVRNGNYNIYDKTAMEKRSSFDEKEIKMEMEKTKKFPLLVREELKKINKTFKEEKIMRFADVKEIVLSEEEITTVYKEKDFRIVKAGNRFEAIFPDVPAKELDANSNVKYPYMAGTIEGANIEKVILNDNDIIVLRFTNNKEIKYTKTAIDKKGNPVLKKVVDQMFVSKEKA